MFIIIWLEKSIKCVEKTNLVIETEPEKAEEMTFEDFKEMLKGIDTDCEACPVKNAIALFQGKWTARVLLELIRNEPLRFKELQRKVTGVTNNMLTVTLKDLEARGLIIRTQYQEVPLRVEYSLTEEGRSLYTIFAAMAAWANEHRVPETKKLSV